MDNNSAGLGRSLIGGGEGLVFVLVLGDGLAFERVWYVATGTSALVLPQSGIREHRNLPGRADLRA